MRVNEPISSVILSRNMYWAIKLLSSIEQLKQYENKISLKIKCSMIQNPHTFSGFDGCWARVSTGPGFTFKSSGTLKQKQKTLIKSAYYYTYNQDRMDINKNLQSTNNQCFGMCTKENAIHFN